MRSSSKDIQSFNELVERIERNYVKGRNQKSTPRPSESEVSETKKRMDELFDEYVEMERKKGTLTDKKYNSICDELSIRLGYDFSDKKITPQTKLFRDARMRADSVKETVAIERPEPHQLQRLYFAPFSPEALKVMVKNKVRPQELCNLQFSLFKLHHSRIRHHKGIKIRCD